MNNKNQSKNIKNIKTQQKKKLLLQVNYALKNTKYYQSNSYPKKISNFADFCKLPFFDSFNFRENNYKFLANKKSVWRIFSTSGTTGRPKLSFYGRDLIKSFEIGVASMLNRAKIKIDGENFACVMFPMGGLTGAGPATARALEGLGIPALTLGIDFDSLYGFEIMKTVKPNILFMYPSAFTIFTNNIEKNGEQPGNLKLKAIFSSGEPLLCNTRKDLESKWNCKIYNTFGSVDIANFTGSECEKQDGFHIFSSNAYFEFINESDKVITDKECQGELALTSFVNSAMPFVRYKTGDIMRYSEEPCSCGDPSPRIWFVARKDDLIILTGAAKIFPSDISQIISQYPELTSAYQIIINRENKKDKLSFVIESKILNKKLADKIVNSISHISSLYRKIYQDKTALLPKVKLVPIGSLERNRGKVKNRLIDLRK